MMPDLRKDYSTTPADPAVWKTFPEPWAEAEVMHHFTITLFAFSWALFPSVSW